jgi:MYXO-CTERM domain-containing protein
MSSLLSAVTSTADETEPTDGTGQSRNATTDSDSGGSRRRRLALAAASLGTALFLRRRRRGTDGGGSAAGTTGELDASTSASDAADGTGGRGLGGRLVRAVVGIAASVLVRRAVRRWRQR